MLEHGGGVRRAAKQYGIELERWLDLSTGINPHAWPVPPLPQCVWHGLPQRDDGLEQAAADYYGCASLLPVAGVQAALQVLPRLRSYARVGLLQPSYNEHAHAWRRAGHTVEEMAAERIDAALAQLDVLLLVNPNNPSGVRFSRTQLCHWLRTLRMHGGLLIVDEAFIDAEPQESIVDMCPQPGLIVLRSFGKFFGMAGARLGFVFAEEAVLQTVQECLGPWAVSGPARWVAQRALRDKVWQSGMRHRLYAESTRLEALLTASGLLVSGGCLLFKWVLTGRARSIQSALARSAIWVRAFDQPPSVRFGLPADEAAWMRLQQALQTIAEGDGSR